MWVKTRERDRLVYAILSTLFSHWFAYMLRALLSDHRHMKAVLSHVQFGNWSTGARGAMIWCVVLLQRGRQVSLATNPYLRVLYCTVSGDGVETKKIDVYVRCT
ncbi:hypothetical protein GGS21DRAFT_524783 [Xylaria nigripes]|nr:hypothetical protein GGS21DRAFT_524783 [Xylaria nigripes]